MPHGSRSGMRRRSNAMTSKAGRESVSASSSSSRRQTVGGIFRTGIFKLALSLPLALLCADAALAEVSTDVFGAEVSTLIVAGAVEDPDPIGSLVWQPVRAIPAERMLNPSGYARGDGRPDIAMADGPVVVWAYSAGVDHDIALSEWDGAAWTPTAFLTWGAEDELDPRVHVSPDGAVHVVWWTAGQVDRVYATERAAGSQSWQAPVLVGTGRRPAVGTSGGELVVAFERDSTASGMAQDVAVATAQPAGGFTLAVIGSTARPSSVARRSSPAAGRRS